jgi:hypothetical protein
MNLVVSRDYCNYSGDAFMKCLVKEGDKEIKGGGGSDCDKIEELNYSNVKGMFI